MVPSCVRPRDLLVATLAAMPALREIVDLVHDWYPPATAESWDAVGLVTGDPDTDVRRVLLAVDPAPVVAREAAELGAELLLVHHPLFLKGVHGVAPVTPKGRTLSTLTAAGCGLLTAHTNADQALGGVSEALARAVGTTDPAPILAGAGPALDQVVVHVPRSHAEAVRRALADAGAGAVGDYADCSFSVVGEGRFRPLAGAQPAIGSVGTPETVAEERVEVVVPRSRRTAVLRALVAAHPYEEPSFAVLELVDPGLAPTGTGRVGEVAPQTLRAFAATVAAALPETAHGVRVAGDPDRPVRRVAVCGGSGDFLLDRLRGSDVDVYLTSDLRHHPASEFCEWDGPALVDVAHWAAEWTWLPVLQRRLREALGAGGDTVDVHVSTACTDPWQFRA
jgi:dinuclear metal center YbgI/SA1388 family protein